jgi:ubiquinol-cytochrome c reductase iron-sulfur subunit
MANNTEGRRDFMGMALGGFTALGGIGALYAMKRTWDPLPSVKAAGFTTIDLSPAQENVLVTEKWRGKPIFILKKSAAMVAKQNEAESARDIVVGGTHYLMCIGLCTHLGCIPGYRPEKDDFLCACHGGTYDLSGIVTKAPPPSPLVIPPFQLKGTELLIGKSGPEYEKMKAAGVVA